MKLQKTFLTLALVATSCQAQPNAADKFASRFTPPLERAVACDAYREALAAKAWYGTSGKSLKPIEAYRMLKRESADRLHDFSPHLARVPRSECGKSVD